MGKSFGGIFDIESKKERLEEVNLELENPDIWNNPDLATKNQQGKISARWYRGRDRWLIRQTR
ncbi:peptide chain release factor 2 [Moraxella catarrhalis 46P47B1]|nr:peptide chain release factor 2 [Moraxella catarrhalis 46P47B1]